MTNSKECSVSVGRFTKCEDEAWCDGFMEAWNVQACNGAATIERIERLEATLDETIKALAEMTEAFNALADMMRRER